MKITKTFWKLELEINAEEIRDLPFNIPSESLRTEFVKMLRRIFTNSFK